MPRLTYEQQHLRNILRLEKRIGKLFDETAARVALLSESVDDFSPEEVFAFDKYPYLRNRAKKLMLELHGALSTTVADGVRTEWDLANAKNDLLVRSVLGSAAKHLSPERRARYFSTNAGACTAFLARRERGMNLSERVWNLTEQFKEELEMGLDLGLRDGVSAVEMSRTLRAYLRNPDALFRRVRDEHGVLHLSERAKAYHPGRGVYRSAYKNARRLAGTEVNIAYRTADHLRMQELDFVVGVEINLSENHTCLGADGKPHRFHDICDDLKGKYPKTFKFTGWHPHCRCFVTPILKTEEEFDADTGRILNGEEPTEGSENEVNELPDEFKSWLQENKGRIDAATARGSLPYFIKDNESLVGSVFAPKTLSDSIVSSREGFYEDEIFRERLLISSQADPKDKEDNIVTARKILSHFPDTHIRIREHVVNTPGAKIKNPEYFIDGEFADQKRIKTENGITSAFVKAIKQGCSVVVVDMDLQFERNNLNHRLFIQRLDGRRSDFLEGRINTCYVIYRGKVISFTRHHFIEQLKDKRKATLKELLKKIEP